MLDLFGIMFSSVLMVFICARAVQFDRQMPWFERVKRREDANAAGAKLITARVSQDGTRRRSG
jgi:hypothetical protein